MTAVDVLVVGAGPAGAATASALARGGARVMVVEAARHPRPKACAEYASPRIREELARLGLPPAAWHPVARPLAGMRLHAGGNRVLISYADRRGPRTAFGVDRRRFDSLLASHATSCGAELREGVRLEGFVDRVATLRTRDGRRERVRVDFLVGADGARSTVARLVGVDSPVRFPRRLGLVAHYAAPPDLGDHGEMHVGGGGYVGLAPLPDDEVNVGMALPMTGSGGSAADRFAAALAALPAVARRLGTVERLTPIRGAAPIGHRVSDVAGDGWLLVGDAAGFVDPFTGEGIHRALRSARAAADALLESDDVAGAYRRERRRAFAAKGVLSWLVQATLAVPPVFERAVARLAERPSAARRLGSALGDCAPATSALSPAAMLEVLGP